MAAARKNGHIEQTLMTEASKCNCCPYGFHIDLGFVDFVENVGSEASNGISRNDRNGLQKYSLKYVGDLNSTVNKWCGTPKQKQARNPLDSIFSDSLENVVSDFEETLNLQESKSERESQNLSNNARKNMRYNGYFSDYGTAQSSNRSLPLKIR
ncbi:unnamed protein product [Cercopithifilaria johnstoni]|uniref:Uncharacterized protein n=1 Tax=Cercopithifilaria johnstoni TaxID=2874296 RepID=A0A8J2MNK8_9BILA|nr:unnamed protein product [Cercopithifilaria johnstoni]